MKPIHKRRLAKLALALLDAWDADKKRLVKGKRELKFDMQDFVGSDKYNPGKSPIPPSGHTCGTSCCFLGFAPLVFPKIAKAKDWNTVVDYLLGGFEEGTWDFLFDPTWPNNAIQAAKRALWILNEGNPKENAQIIYPRMKPVHLRESLLAFAQA